MGKKLLKKLIVRLWSRQYYLAYEAPDTVRTRLERRLLKRTARWLIDFWERQQ